MAFFKFRKTGAEAVAPAAPAESVEALRRRARQRLIGASVLVLAGVIGFPLVFDSQPRPIPVDIPIEIPDRGKAGGPAATNSAVGSLTAAAPASAPVAPAFVAPAAEPAPAASVAPAPSAPSAAPAAAPAVEAAAPPAPRPAASATPARAGASAADGDRAKALLEGKPASAAAGEGRFVVQVGAFADPALAQAARQKLERAGLKTYTHVAETKEGKRIRVRVGPFGSRAEADKAAAKVKGLDLPAAVLTL